MCVGILKFLLTYKCCVFYLGHLHLFLQPTRAFTVLYPLHHPVDVIVIRVLLTARQLYDWNQKKRLSKCLSSQHRVRGESGTTSHGDTIIICFTEWSFLQKRGNPHQNQRGCDTADTVDPRPPETTPNYPSSLGRCTAQLPTRKPGRRCEKVTRMVDGLCILWCGPDLPVSWGVSRTGHKWNCLNRWKKTRF